ncbi:hypothetical protein [Moorella sulfitireducens (nom. illeg.)]|uniref:hypothetical protein n=1 Tax=Neomoorella sulfitireducens TaxID=2972948 RepID=UPI0021ABABE4|nr:hypothetical protein [Moorella sulfitireducens]
MTRNGGWQKPWLRKKSKKREQFVRSILREREGIAAEREKFLHDLKTGSIKKL